MVFVLDLYVYTSPIKDTQSQHSDWFCLSLKIQYLFVFVGFCFLLLLFCRHCLRPLISTTVRTSSLLKVRCKGVNLPESFLTVGTIPVRLLPLNRFTFGDDFIEDFVLQYFTVSQLSK